MRAASVIFALLFFTMVGTAQTPAKPAAGAKPAAKPAAPAGQAPAKPAAGAPVRVTAKVQGNLAQVMRGILFPNSNIIFDAQNKFKKSMINTGKLNELLETVSKP